MYRVYLRTPNQQVSEKTNTGSQSVALEAFTELVNCTELDGEKIAAVFSYQNRQLAFHWFDRIAGESDYWRDRLDKIDLPKSTVGAPTELTDGKRVNVYLDASSLAVASDLGDGNVSAGIRIALTVAKKIK